MTDSSSGPGMIHGEFTIRRILDAPRELVWEAWTDPEHLSRWWGPRGLSTPMSTIELDLRPGGTTHYAGWNTEQMHRASNAGWESQFERLEELLAKA
jgi:uncharacterized protein YndB with AHSA1/START domain